MGLPITDNIDAQRGQAIRSYRVNHWSPEIELAWAQHCYFALKQQGDQTQDYWPLSIRFWRAARQVWASQNNLEGMRLATLKLRGAQIQDRALRRASK